MLVWLVTFDDLVVCLRHQWLQLIHCRLFGSLFTLQWILLKGSLFDECHLDWIKLYFTPSATHVACHPLLFTKYFSIYVGCKIPS